MTGTLTATPAGVTPSAQSFSGNMPVSSTESFLHMIPSSHPPPQMAASSRGIMPPMPSMGIVPPSDLPITSRYFGTSTHNAAPVIGCEAALKHSTFGGTTGLGSFPKPAGNNGPQMPILPQMPGAYSGPPSGSLGLPSVPGAPSANYGTGSTAGLYQQKPRLDPNLMPSVVCS